MGSMTFEEALALIREDNAMYRAEREAADAKYKAEKETESAKFYAALEADRKKWEEELKETRKKDKLREKHWNQMSQTLGSLKLTMGELVEMVIMPKVNSEINKFGHKFHIASANKFFYRDNGDIVTEVDLMLENCDEAFILEIKSSFRASDIKEHLKRLKILRKHEERTAMKGRLMYAGIAGISINSYIRDLAHSHGMYVLTIREEEERIEVAQPETKGQW